MSRTAQRRQSRLWWRLARRGLNAGRIVFLVRRRASPYGIRRPDDGRRSKNGKTFLAYVERQLAPTLATGDVVVMDNLAADKVNGVRQAIKAVGARLLYLPPYSPDFNPIEQASAKLKWLLRTATE